MRDLEMLERRMTARAIQVRGFTMAPGKHSVEKIRRDVVQVLEAYLNGRYRKVDMKKEKL